MKKLTTKEFIDKSNIIHNNKYLYSKTFYEKSKIKVCITCPIHGDFYIRPNNHLLGQGCPLCGGTQKMDTETFIEKANIKHNFKYDYSKTEYKSSKDKVCIICPEHGEFWQIASSHLFGIGCPYCSNNLRLTTDEFIQKAKGIHGDKYDYSKVDYINYNTKVCIICPEHGEFWQTPDCHLSGEGCPLCNHYINSSKAEKEIVEYIKSIYNSTIKENYRSLFDDKSEVDIYLPDLSIAIEYNGLYWHNELNHSSRSYHKKKTDICEAKNIQLIQIFEDEWLFKKDIVKSRLCNLLHSNPNKIYARKCIIKTIDNNVANIFLDENHIQGKCVSKYRYGLYYNNELVSIMTFGKLRKNLGANHKEGSYELLRFCNKKYHTVIGGADKLFKYFLKNNSVEKVISYADRRWSCGKLYEKLGFDLINVSQPSYFYVLKDKRENRFKYRKDILIKQGYDKNKSEHQIMLDRKIYRIYDCGCRVYSFSNKKATN